MFDLLSPMAAMGIGAVIICAVVLLVLPAGGRLPGFVAPITARPLMNKSEQRLYGHLKTITAQALPDGHEVMSQVSYGEFLRCKDRKIFWSFNAKRADFLIVDGEINPVAVIEYQGTGHSGRTMRSRADADKRDRVKRRTLKAAGIPMIEIPAKFTAESVRKLIDDALPQGTKAGSHLKSA